MKSHTKQDQPNLTIFAADNKMIDKTITKIYSSSHSPGNPSNKPKRMLQPELENQSRNSWSSYGGSSDTLKCED